MDAGNSRKNSSCEAGQRGGGQGGCEGGQSECGSEQSGCGAGQSGCEGGQSPSGCRVGKKHGCETQQMLRQTNVSDSDPAGGPASSCSVPCGTDIVRHRRLSAPLPVWTQMSAHRLSSPGTAPARPRSGPRPTPPAAASPGRRRGVTGLSAPGPSRRRSAAGVPPRSQRGSEPASWVRPNRRQRTTDQR